MSELTLERLHSAVAGDSVALRSHITLQLAGGEGEKVFPPSYAVASVALQAPLVVLRQTSAEQHPSEYPLRDPAAVENREP